MPRLTVNNIGMHYVEAGQGSPLLLLHGVGGSHEMWLSIIPELAKSYRVIAADHRGHGASDKPRGSVRSAVEACITHDMRGRLGEIQAPTLVMVGSEDRLTPAFHSEYLARSIPKARLVVIDGSGHIPHLERPREFLKTVREFLTRA